MKNEVGEQKYLPNGFVLDERYEILQVIGRGSYGITYCGKDTIFEDVVAIKEYYPLRQVYRKAYENDYSLYLYDEDDLEEYKRVQNKFMEEARTLSKLKGLEHVVAVRDFFYENQTAYMVMDYIDGISLKKLIETRGAVSGEWLLEHFTPLLQSLQQIHRCDLIHRDISPDNIIMNSKEQLMLIDFGSARDSHFDADKSITVMFKKGYSPAEQYHPHGHQGVWSDIYSISATMYYCLTGKVPDEALERVFKDDVLSLMKMPDVDLTMEQKKAIMKGMSVKPEERYISVNELCADLLLPKKGKKNWIGISGIAVALLIGIFILGKMILVDSDGKTNVPVSNNTAVTQEAVGDKNESSAVPTKNSTVKPTVKEKEKVTKKPAIKATARPTARPTVKPTVKPIKKKQEKKKDQLDAMIY